MAAFLLEAFELILPPEKKRLVELYIETKLVELYIESSRSVKTN
jgi:hypothetical protein